MQVSSLTRIYWDKSKLANASDAVSGAASVLSRDQFLKAVALLNEAPFAMTERAAEVEARVDELVAKAIEKQSKDKQFVEIDVATKVADRIMGWAKIFGFFLALPAAVLLLVLGIFGVSKFEDVQKAANSVDAKVVEAQTKLDTATLRAAQIVAKTEQQLATLQSNINTQSQQINTIDRKVTQIAESLSFSSASDLPGNIKEKLSSTAAAFLAYFQRLGYVPKSPLINVKIEGSGFVADYTIDDNTIVLSQSAANDDFPLLREYSHRILYSSLTFDAFPPKVSLLPIEWGLANYFSASFLNRPKLGEVIAAASGLPYFYNYNLESKEKITELAPKSGVHALELQHAWGGLFWDLRTKLGQSITDRLLFDSWRSISDQENDAIAQKFIESILTHLPQQAGTEVIAVRQVLLDRGLWQFGQSSPPVLCPELYQPVCGLSKDGKRTTYSNECQAKSTGANDIKGGMCAKSK